jgi:GNAT superfamily N-acetyltransferase
VFQIEAIERDALISLHNSATDEDRQAAGLSLETISGVTVSIAAKLPPTATAVNRAIGLGLDRPAEPETITALADAYERAGVGSYIVHWHPDASPSRAATWIAGRGFVRAPGWMKFVRGRSDAPTPRPHRFEVRRIGSEDAAAFARIVCASLELGKAAQGWLSRLPSAPGWQAFMSFDDGVAAGAGAVYISGETAWLDWCATVPAFRGKGSHSALLAARIGAALDHGCRTITTCTRTDPDAGEDHQSYANIVRAGFRESYLRDNYKPQKS